MKLPHLWSKALPLFDGEHLVSEAGLIPVMALAEQAELSKLIGERVWLGQTRVASAGVNPAGKVSSMVAGMAASADSIDGLQVVRSGGMRRLFDEVYAPAALGRFLREFTHGHSLQWASVARAHLVNLAKRTDLLPGIGIRTGGPGLQYPPSSKAKQEVTPSKPDLGVIGQEVIRLVVVFDFEAAT